MRRGKSWAVLAILALAGCSSSKPFRDMVGYVPPTSLPAQPKRTMIQDLPHQVWNNLMTFLQQSDFDVDHTDHDKKLIVARYSGNPELYVDCGSIVTHENGALGQIPGSAENVILNYKLDDQPVVLKRALYLDSRIIIRLEEQSLGTVVSTDTTYVVTKTIDIEKSSGNIAEGSRETVSFSAGKRAEFSKGTACQPNGSLDVAILQSLPNVIGSNEITRADLPVDLSEQSTVILPDQQKSERSRVWVETDHTTTGRLDQEHPDATVVPGKPDDLPAEDRQNNWTFAKPDLSETVKSKPNQITAPIIQEQVAAPETPLSNPPATSGGPPQKTTHADLNISDTGLIVDETTRTLLATLDCQGAEWHFCEIVELTAPFRKLNIENTFGLTINTAENFASQIIGSDLKLDVDLPSFPAYLHIIYVERDGTIDHVVSSSKLWPADLTHRFQETGHSIPGPSGLAMIVAVVSEQPLFPPGQTGKEEAAFFLSGFEQRLTEIDALTGNSRIAASQLLINVE